MTNRDLQCRSTGVYNSLKQNQQQNVPNNPSSSLVSRALHSRVQYIDISKKSDFKWFQMIFTSNGWTTNYQLINSTANWQWTKQLCGEHDIHLDFSSMDLGHFCFFENEKSRSMHSNKSGLTIFCCVNLEFNFFCCWLIVRYL